MKKRLKKLLCKRRLKRASQGVISVFLCLLLTPFLTISLGLIEYARYQEFVEVADELMDLLGVSEIADYDPYLHQRFGLLAVSQEKNLGSGAEELLIENAKVLPGQMTPSNVTVTGLGGATLKDNRVLLKQVTDVSELTATMAVAMKDLQLERIFDKLNSLSTFSAVMNTVEDLAVATDSVTAVVEAAKKLQSDLAAAKTSVDMAVSKGKELADKMSALARKLGEAGITLPESATEEQIKEAVLSFQDTYLEDINEVYKLAKEFSDQLNAAKGSFDTLTGDVKRVTDEVRSAKSAIQNIGGTQDGEDDSVSKGTVTTLTDILDDMEKLVEDSLKSIKDDAIKTVTDAVGDTVDLVLNSTGLNGVVEKYYQIVSGKYFVLDDTLTLSDEAKQDVVDFLKMVYKVYDEHKNNGDVEGAMRSYFEGRFIPNSIDSIDLQSIADQISTVISKAGSGLTNSAEAKLTDMITKLVNLSRKIFKLTITSDPRLNNTVTLVNAGRSEVQSFIDAVDKLCASAEDFKSSIGSLNVIKALRSLADMFSAIKDMFTAIVNKIGSMVNGIAAAFNGGLKKLYQRFIVSGYMFHTLPNRLDAGDYTDGGAMQKVNLKGTSLTGYNFNDISRGAMTFKACECEYIYSGSNSETANQVNFFWDLYFLRLILDMPSVFTNAEVTELAAVANVAAWVVYILYIIIEPFLDVILIVNGETVDIYKSYCWMTASRISGFVTKFLNAMTDCDDIKKLGECEEIKNLASGFVDDMSGEMGSGGGDDGHDPLELSYENYLLVLMALTVTTDDQIQRLSNLINLEMQQYCADNGGTFNLGRSYVAVTVSADFTFSTFFDLGTASGGSPFIPGVHVSRTVSY